MNCEEIKDFEDIIMDNKSEIIEHAWGNGQCNGVVQINVDDGELLYRNSVLDDIDNPCERVVVVYSLPDGFDAEDLCDCSGCLADDYDGGCCNSMQLDECVRDLLDDDFDCRFDDIMSCVYGSIEECGYDL